MEDQEPDKDHGPRENADQFYLEPENDCKACADEGDGGKISPEKVAGNPVGDEVLNPFRIQKVFDTEDDQHDRIEKAAKGYQCFQWPEERLILLTGDLPVRVTSRYNKGAAGNGQVFEGIVPIADLVCARIKQQFEGYMAKEQGKQQAAQEQHDGPDLFFQHERDGSSDQKEAEEIDEDDLAGYLGREGRNEYGVKAPIIKLLACQPDQTDGIKPATDFSKIFHSEAVFGGFEYKKPPRISLFRLVQVGSSYRLTNFFTYRWVDVRICTK